MKMQTKVANVFDRANDFLAFLAGIIVIFMMFSVAYEVLLRYFVGVGVLWVTEITEYGLLFITFLSAAWLLRKEGHVRANILVDQLGPRSQALLNVITSSLGAIMCLVVTWYTAQTTCDSFQMGYLAATALRTPVFLYLFIIPVGTFLLFMQFLRSAYSSLRRLRQTNP